MTEQEITIYTMSAVAGFLAGLVRFCKYDTNLTVRAILSFTLFGSLLSLVTVGLLHGNDVEEVPWRCLAESLLVGFIQPEGLSFLTMLTRLGAKGLLLPPPTKKEEDK